MLMLSRVTSAGNGQSRGVAKFTEFKAEGVVTYLPYERHNLQVRPQISPIAHRLSPFHKT